MVLAAQPWQTALCVHWRVVLLEGEMSVAAGLGSRLKRLCLNWWVKMFIVMKMACICNRRLLNERQVRKLIRNSKSWKLYIGWVILGLQAVAVKKLLLLPACDWPRMALLTPRKMRWKLFDCLGAWLGNFGLWCPLLPSFSVSSKNTHLCFSGMRSRSEMMNDWPYCRSSAILWFWMWLLFGALSHILHPECLAEHKVHPLFWIMSVEYFNECFLV